MLARLFRPDATCTNMTEASLSRDGATIEQKHKATHTLGPLRDVNSTFVLS